MIHDFLGQFILYRKWRGGKWVRAFMNVPYYLEMWIEAPPHSEEGYIPPGFAGSDAFEDNTKKSKYQLGFEAALNDIKDGGLPYFLWQQARSDVYPNDFTKGYIAALEIEMRDSVK